MFIWIWHEWSTYTVRSSLNSRMFVYVDDFSMSRCWSICAVKRKQVSIMKQMVHAVAWL